MPHMLWTDMSGQPLPEKEIRGPYLVYTHVCLANGKSYVGLTRQNELSRWENGIAYRDNPAFFADIERYGWENFIHRIEIRGLSETDALILESILIQIGRTSEPEFGYNRLEYGTAGWEPTEEQRRLMSEKKKEFLSAHPEAIERLAQTHRGIPRTAEEKARISLSLKGVPKSPQHRKNISFGIAMAGKSIPVRCVETGVLYPSACAAGRSLSISDAGIGRCCRGTQKTAGGFHWEYAPPVESPQM